MRMQLLFILGLVNGFALLVVGLAEMEIVLQVCGILVMVLWASLLFDSIK